MTRKQLDIFAVGGAALTVAAFAAIVLATRAALGQPASMPASQPVIVAGGAWSWCVTNASWLVPLLSTALATIATGLSDYPAATPAGASRVARVVRALRIAVSLLSLAQFKNAPGSLKALFAPPSKA